MGTNRSQLFERAKAKTAEKAKTPAPEPQEPRRTWTARQIEVYYDISKQKFWSMNHAGEWMEIGEASLKRILKSYGYSPDCAPSEYLSPLDKKILELQLSHGVHFAGEVAGYVAGPVEICGSKILVTRGRRPITPAKGDCTTLRAFVGELLGEQAVYAFAWLKSALEALEHGCPWRPGQVLAIAGPAGCGKSLFQNLVTELFGGRSAKPFRYLMGESSFNKDLLAAEHLMIEDEAASTDLRVRRHFGAQLKNMVVNYVQSLHAKGKDALSITPFCRVSMTLNDEPENLMVLPPLDDSLRDKIILLRAFRVCFPYEAEDLKGRQAYWDKLRGELPAFVHRLRGWKVPQRLKDLRYGVKAFQEPGLLTELQDLQPEDRLLHLIETLMDEGRMPTPWRGSATQLETLLREKYAPAMIQNLLHYPTACGVYLGRLRGRLPARFERVRGVKNTHVWEIREEPPA